MTTRLTSFVGSIPFLRKISRATTASDPSGDMIPMFLPRNCATDLISGSAIKSQPGLSWNTVTSLDRNSSDRRRQRAAGVGEKIDFAGERRANCDLAANAEQLDVEAFFFEVAFLLRNDERKDRRVHRRIGDAEVIYGACRLDGDEQKYRTDKNPCALLSSAS